MKSFFITFRSVTHAQRAEEALRNAGMSASLSRTPRALEARGCGYRIRTDGRFFTQAVDLLRQKGIPYSKLYAVREDGKMEEFGYDLP